MRDCMLVLTTPVSIDKIHNDLAIESLVERPDEQIRQQHEEADNEATDDEYVAKDERKYVCFHPVPDATHGRQFLPRLSLPTHINRLNIIPVGRYS